MGEKSGNDVAGISAILLRASSLTEATPELVWSGKPAKPVGGGKPQRSRVSQGQEAALDSAVQGVPTTGMRLMFSPLRIPTPTPSPRADGPSLLQPLAQGQDLVLRICL
jgi:hypothetical protein